MQKTKQNRKTNKKTLILYTEGPRYIYVNKALEVAVRVAYKHCNI